MRGFYFEVKETYCPGSNLRPPRYAGVTMKMLAWLMETFIATFGITRPRPGQERAAQLVIGGFLLAAIAGAAGIVVFFLWR